MDNGPAGFPPTWCHLYGYAKDDDGRNDDIHNGPTNYHGKMLVSIVSEARPNAALGSSNIPAVPRPAAVCGDGCAWHS